MEKSQTAAPQIEVRCYEELNDRLAPQRRRRSFALPLVREGETVGEVIARLRLAEQEVDLALVNGCSVGLDHPLKGGERLALYPLFESFDVGPVQRLRPEPLRQLRFVADAHLGRLAAYLRMLGFDTLYGNDPGDDELLRLSLEEGRFLLTRDRALLRRPGADRGYLVTSQRGREQLREVVERFHLQGPARPFTRCLRCNGTVVPVTKAEVASVLRPTTRRLYREFWRCSDCGRIYWKGSHYRRMQRLVSDTLEQGSREQR